MASNRSSNPWIAVWFGVFLVLPSLVGCSSAGATADASGGTGGGAPVDGPLDVTVPSDAGSDLAPTEIAADAAPADAAGPEAAAPEVAPGPLTLKDYQGTWTASDGTVTGSDGVMVKSTALKLKVERLTTYWGIDATAETAIPSSYARFHFSTELHESADGSLKARCYDTSDVMRPVGRVDATGLTISENLDANCVHREGTISLRPMPGGRLAIEFRTSSGDGTAAAGMGTLSRMSP